ncbi:carbohydrate kinase family protein [Patescibacteria group bacterium]|nr:carbohydrate kinase family protein [Patescibacteria group bacterium]
MKIFLVGSLAFDHAGQFNGRFSDVIKAEHVQKLSVSFFVENEETFLGGTCGNIAYGLSLLGVKAYILTVIGEDGDQYMNSLRDAGMNTDFLKQLPGPTANAHLLTDLDENQIAFFSPGVISTHENVFALPEVAESGDIILVGPENHDVMISAISQGWENGLKVYFDPGQQIHSFSKDEILDILDKTDGLFVNNYEWELITSISGLDYEAIQSKVSVIFLTKGSQGANIFEKANTVVVPAVPVEKVADPTGAGDAFRAGVIAGLSKGLSTEDSAKMGAILGAASVMNKQTQGYSIPEGQLPFLENLGFSL